MMKANELRIGNLVGVGENALHADGGKNEIYEISELKTDVVQFRNFHSGEYYKDLKPIPLTEEWLLKFGFKNINSTYTIDNDRFEFSFMFYDAWNLYYKEKKGFGCDEINLTGFWNIHQLQNLYFALTGEEL